MTKQEYNAYKKAYMQKYRANMSDEKYRQLRNKENERDRLKWQSMSQEEKQKHYEKVALYKKLKSFKHD